MPADGACRQMSPAREMAPRARGAYVVSGQRLMCDDVEQAPRRRPVQRSFISLCIVPVRFVASRM